MRKIYVAAGEMQSPIVFNFCVSGFDLALIKARGKYMIGKYHLQYNDNDIILIKVFIHPSHKGLL